MFFKISCCGGLHIANKNALSENILPDCVQVTLAVSRLIDCSASAAAS